ncbi:MAG: DUF58 domain-containing protein [Sulfurimonadaceae bacterium]|nr:DUF58 domain-containing protein [Sulfurimonadaceae bacterium]
MRFLRLSRQTSRRTTARITKYFWLLVVVICGLFLQAYMHNFNIVYISLFFLVGFGVVSEFMGRSNLARIEVKVLSVGRIFANRPSPYTLQLKNRSDAPSYAVTAENGNSEGEVGRVAAHTSAIATLQALFTQRGAGVLAPTELVSYYPLPHLRFGKRFEHEREVVVYPEPKGESLRELLSRNRSISGERDDFDGVRRYESGDTASLIYWPSVARGETVMSKQFILDEPSRKLRFEFASLEGDDETRLSQLALWILECEKSGQPFSIVMPSEVLDSQQRGIDEILETLARY